MLYTPVCIHLMHIHPISYTHFHTDQHCHPTCSISSPKSIGLSSLDLLQYLKILDSQDNTSIHANSRHIYAWRGCRRSSDRSFNSNLGQRCNICERSTILRICHNHQDKLDNRLVLHLNRYTKYFQDSARI